MVGCAASMVSRSRNQGSSPLPSEAAFAFKAVWMSSGTSLTRISDISFSFTSFFALLLALHPHHHELRVRPAPTSTNQRRRALLHCQPTTRGSANFAGRFLQGTCRHICQT